MKHIHVFWSELHFLLIQDVEILHAYIVLFIEETFFLDSGHVQDVQSRHCIFQTDNLFIRNAFAVEYIVTDIFRKTQLLRGDQYETDPFIPDQGIDQGVDSTAEFQVAAQTDGHVAEPPLQIPDGQQVSQCLRRMLVPSVAGVDDRDRRVLAGYHGRSFLGMSHGADVCIA